MTDSDIRRRNVRRAVLGLVAAGLVAVLAIGGGGWYLQRQLAAQVGHIPHAFAGLTHRPKKPAEASRATNILLIGSDRRSTGQTTGSDASAQTWLPGEQRSDTMMVVHVSADRRDVTVVSIPRDSWVDIPGHGTHKINAAFSYAGPSLTVQTVEQLTGVRIDHLAVIDWDGFKRLTNVLGGVDVQVPHTVYDSARRKTWTAGWHHLDGAQALLYVRERHGLPAGDFDRVKRQQYLLRLLLQKALHQGMWTNPATRYRTLSAVTQNLTVDADWTTGQLRHLVHQISGLGAQHYFFTTVPVAGTGRVGAEDVVFLDRAADHGLWSAVNRDRSPQWFAQHPTSRLGSSVD
jgi:LCP family protein required for cell wall assembly